MDEDEDENEETEENSDKQQVTFLLLSFIIHSSHLLIHPSTHSPINQSINQYLFRLSIHTLSIHSPIHQSINHHHPVLPQGLYGCSTAHRGTQLTVPTMETTYVKLVLSSLLLLSSTTFFSGGSPL